MCLFVRSLVTLSGRNWDDPIEVEGLTDLAEIFNPITLHIKTKFIRGFEGDKGRTRHQMVVHGPESAAPFDLDISGPEALAQYCQRRNFVEAVIRPILPKDQFAGLLGKVSNRHPVRYRSSTVTIQCLERFDGRKSADRGGARSETRRSAKNRTEYLRTL